MFLTTEQVNFFRQTGYFKLEEQLPETLVDELKIIVQKNIDQKIEPFRADADERIYRVSALLDREPVFYETFSSNIFIEPLQSLLGPNIELVRNRHNHATVNYKGSISRRLHRDILQWSRSLVTVLLYLEESTLDNGCTEVIPTSNYFPFVGKPNNGGTWMDEHSIYTGLINQSLPIPMPKGGILLIDSLCFHTVGENRTDNTRMSITMGYHSVDELSKLNDDSDRVLVCGERIYKGNDK